MSASNPITHTWGRRIDALALAERKVEKIVNAAIDLVLIVFGVVGFGLLLYRFVQLSILGQPVWFFWQIKDGLMLIVWLSFMLDGFLLYRVQWKFGQIKTLPAKATKQSVDISRYFSYASLAAIEKAWELAQEYKHGLVLPIHLFIALLMQGEISILFWRLGVKPDALRHRLAKVLAKEAKAMDAEPKLSDEFMRILESSFNLAESTKQSRVELTELLVATVEKDQLIEDMLYEIEVEVDDIRNVASWRRVREQLSRQWRQFKFKAQYKPKSGINRAMTAIATPILETFASDLTTAAKFAYLSPCVAREKELDQIFNLIKTGSKRGAILVGQPGVGKETILHGVAQLMAAEDVPKTLQDKRLLSFDVNKIIAGVSPAVAEKRLLVAIEEVVRSGNIILAVPNIHHWVGVSVGSSGSLDLAAALATAINKYKLQVVATATTEEFRRFLESHALTQALEVIQVDEPKGNQAIQILEAKTGPIEYKHKVFFSYAAIEQAINLSDRYLVDRFLPDKAVQILEQAASKFEGQAKSNYLISGDDIAAIVSDKTNIPLTKITEAETDKLLDLEQRIHERYVNQEEGVNLIASSIRRARAEMRDSNRPISNFLFLGPTGVGKTELAKTLAAIYFGAEANMIRVDMSEYQEPGSVSRLIGSSAGVGTGVAGYLTEAVRQKPFSIVLLDELEKAHPDILNILLQVMDDGRLTDGKGRTIDFTNTIIIGTSNAHTQLIQERIQQGKSVAEIHTELMETGALEKFFRPELINRFDGVVVFRPLNMSEVQKIAALMLDKVRQRLANKGLKLEVTDAGLQDIANAGYNPKFGARPLRRVIQTQVEDVIAKVILEKKVKRRDTVVVGKDQKVEIKPAPEL
ncbi:MAG: hypothetical protein COT81_02715 [Candidatus Buchananbacteria bacterium CG10_big_fil_rev_8_21_14_0_10_42_9]|uniref:Clp R domain-containing protein n=1 Tax=Candidatus Buchananbacteria bacterium CG10_big_fil_rev_8_21_14_0_10_42_9 TaxID=1974526 RepID=A0A2H0W1C1_9BACT|nr:MAG: hypothetical protein COT81_02715 [Candidatus Buchananbacteria bacterium CG10_big_fil_rev_8_21_14_0_10_42_9]